MHKLLGGHWLFAISVVMAGCTADDVATPDAGGAGKTAGTGGTGGTGGHAAAAHWSYSGDTGPSHWAEIDEMYAACGNGSAQTPIDIPAATAPGIQHALKFDYKSSALTILNNGHTVQANYDTGSHIELDATTYQLAQFHFHAHSEHTIAGKSYPLELHLVHRSADMKLAVVGVFIDEGDENAALADVFSNLPKTESEPSVVKDVSIDASKFLPEHAWAWRYEGSLTTPPCSEGVKWSVIYEPIHASSAQIKAFTSIFADDYRPTQSLGDRTIDGAHFDYADDEGGPTHWSELAPGWESCEAGKQQSPIDIPSSAQPAIPQDLVLSYKAAPLSIVNNGHTVQINYPEGSEITLGGTSYSLVQFHFHAHSEHTIAGKSYPLELHLVHRNADGGLAVIGILIEAGAANAALDAVFANMPLQSGPAQTYSNKMIDISKVLPSQLTMWRYDGSLTTPPCSEAVKWHVLSEPIQASAEQISHFTQLYVSDARPTQPLGSRTVK